MLTVLLFVCNLCGCVAMRVGQRNSFEGFILHRFGRWWNRGVDNVHGRLLGLPDTVDRIVDDVKGKSSDAANTNE